MSRSVRILVLLSFLLMPLACRKTHVLTIPVPPPPVFSPTETPTGTWGTPLPTATSTPTWTPFPAADCATLTADVTSNIDGAPVTGNTTGSANRFTEGLNYASPDHLYRFVLAAPTTLEISLCGSTALGNWDSFLYLRSEDCNGPTSAYDDDGCGTSNFSAMPVTLAAGTHYLVVDGWGSLSPEQGPFELTLRTYRSPTPTFTGTPTATWTWTDSPTHSSTPTITATPTDTWTGTRTDTVTHTHTTTRTPSFTDTPVFTSTSTPTATFSPTWTMTGTQATPTWTFSPTITHTVPASCASFAPMDVTSQLMTGGAVTGTTSGKVDDFAYTTGGSGSLSGDDLYVFHLTASRTVTLSLCRTTAVFPAWDAVLYLRSDCGDPGTNLDYSDDACSSLPMIVRTLSPGTYYLVVDGYGNSSPQEGGYVLGFGGDGGAPVCTVTPASGAVPETEPNDAYAAAGDLGEFSQGDVVRTGTIIAANDLQDRYLLRVPCGWFVDHQVSLDCFTDGYSTDMSLTVEDASFSEVGIDAGPGPALSVPFSGLPGSLYYVTIHGGTGPYRLRVAATSRTAAASSGILPELPFVDESESNDSRATSDSLGGLAPGGALSAKGTVDGTDTRDFFVFTAQTGTGTVRVTLDGYGLASGGQDLDLVVTDSGGATVAGSQGNDPVEQATFIAAQGAVYHVGVVDPGPSKLCYRLLVQDIPAVTCQSWVVADVTDFLDGPAVTGDTAGKTDHFASCVGAGSPDDAYILRIDAPTNIQVSLCGGASWDTGLHLYASDCATELACDDDGCGSQSVVTYAAPVGRYVIVVDGYGGAAGAYQLTLSTY